MSYDSRERSRHSAAPVKLYLVQGAENAGDTDDIGPYGYTDGEVPITRDGIEYVPWAIKHSDISHDGSLDKSDVTVTMALGTVMDSLFLSYPPAQVVNLTIRQGNVGDAVTDENYPAIWIGRILGAGYSKSHELALSCQPVSTSIRRPGLRRNYQTGCPHVLYGSECRADKAAASVNRVIQSMTGNKITLTESLGTNGQQYVGGLVEWVNALTQRRELRTISAVSSDMTQITIRGINRGTFGGQTITLSRGCNHLMSGCNQHNNIHNFGGQPFIPLENPLSTKNQFY